MNTSSRTRTSIKGSRLKATHTGQCQVCDARQKLPGGVLAKHGYTRRFHFFEGVCVGAGHLPFEQDTSLIQGMIDMARQRAADLRARAADERQGANPDSCWYHMYLVDQRGRGSYEWRMTRLRQGEYNQIQYEHPADGRQREPAWKRVYGGMPYDLQVCAQACAEQHAKYLEGVAEECDRYVTWQEGRIANWQPQPLTPIE